MSAVLTEKIYTPLPKNEHYWNTQESYQNSESTNLFKCLLNINTENFSQVGWNVTKERLQANGQFATIIVLGIDKSRI